MLNLSAIVLFPSVLFSCEDSRMREADEIIAREMSGQSVACKKGCAWCCHQLVIVTNWADGEVILEAARQRMTADEFEAFTGQVTTQAAAIRAMPHEEAERLTWTCPLLRDDECVVYDVRPVACRSVMSSDSECCRAMMEASEFGALPKEHQSLATEISERAFRLQIAINDRRPVDRPIELRVLLKRLLEQESASGD